MKRYIRKKWDKDGSLRKNGKVDRRYKKIKKRKKGWRKGHRKMRIDKK